MEDDNKIDVLSNDEFYNVRNCIQSYINYIKDENFEAIIRVLDDNYSNQNNIKIEILEQSFQDSNKTNFIVNSMKKIEKSLDINVYYVDGYLSNDDCSDLENANFTVLIDNEKDLFSIIPENFEENNSFKYNTNLKVDNIDYYNKIIYQNFSSGDIVKEYFNLYRNLAVNNTEVAFSLLNSEYKEKRFNNSIDNYKKFLDEIDIKNSYLSKFAYNIEEDYNEYVSIDKNGLYYIFRETSPMNFSLLLDTYTIETEKFLTTYQTSNDKEKVMMNVDKFILMLNNRDYTSAYKLLDDTFKNNNFSSEENFELYMKNRLPSYYEIEYGSFEEKGGNIFVQKIQLKSIVDENLDVLNFSVIMKLQENTDFVMSFEV